MLDNGYVYPADVRMSVYRDASRWLMIIETLGASNPRMAGCDSLQNCLHLFGNALHRKPGTSNDDFLFPIRSCPDTPLFDEELSDWFLRPGSSVAELREQRVTFDVSPSTLTARGIVCLEPPKIDPPAFLRSLLPEYRDILLASEEELAQRNPHRLPLWLKIDAWHHPDLAGDELPSDCETFLMLATAISEGDPSLYRPTLSPNTHWKHWPEGGTL